MADEGTSQSLLCRLVGLGCSDPIATAQQNTGRTLAILAIGVALALVVGAYYYFAEPKRRYI